MLSKIVLSNWSKKLIKKITIINIKSLHYKYTNSFSCNKFNDLNNRIIHQNTIKHNLFDINFSKNVYDNKGSTYDTFIFERSTLRKTGFF